MISYSQHLKMYSTRLMNATRLFNQEIPRTSSHSVLLIGHRRFCGKYSGYGRRIGVWFNEQSIQVARACTKQFGFVIAQRIRRSFQLFHLYTKLWNEIALKEFKKSWSRRLGRNTKEFLMGSVGVTMFNWDRERISDDELYSYSREIEIIEKLRDSTVVCKVCHLRLIVDNPHPNVKYCTCDDKKSRCAVVNNDLEWQPFIERQDMLVWRREEPNTSGLYAYKVFGTFSDVTAEEFLQVQVDVDYRKVWDATAQELKIIDTDPESLSAEDHRTDVIYWEMIWPRLFSNRDYVYQRRWVVDKEKGIILIVSRVVDHPDAPNRPDTYRVSSYWSYMVIRPCVNFKERGIEFGLTYFDDPGVNIPSAVTAWVAKSGLPDFLCRMRQAAKDYKQYINSKTNEDTKLCNIITVSDSEEVDSAIISDTQSTELIESDQKVVDVAMLISEDISNVQIGDSQDKCKVEDTNNDVKSEENDSGGLSEQEGEKQRGFLRYYFLTKLFA